MVLLKFLLPVFFIIYSFSELLRFQLAESISIGFIDIIAAGLVIYWIFFVKKSSYYLKLPIIIFLLTAILSQIYNLGNFNINQLEVGLLYLFRWILYALLYFVFVNIGKKYQKNIKVYMLTSGIFILIFGFVQYLYYPSLKNLFLDYKQDLDEFPFRHNHLKKDDRLLPTLSRYIKNFSALSAVKIRLKVRGKEKKLSPKIHDNLFQICREAITNVIRHAEANKVEINLVFGRDRLRATIKDDGKGFVLDKSEGDYFGIRGMRERTQILGGELVIHTAPGIGTKIGMSIPVDKRGF